MDLPGLVRPAEASIRAVERVFPAHYFVGSGKTLGERYSRVGTTMHVERVCALRAIEIRWMRISSGGRIEVIETAEVPVVSKQARVVEEVIVGKKSGERDETIQETLLRQDVDVEPLPKTGTGGRR